jgi:four helix bundle protein
MSKYTRFEDVPVWQEAARLYNMVLDLFEEPGSSLSLGFRNQLDRAALSVSNNIAEGFEGMSTEELVKFLGIARASAGEVRSMTAAVHQRPSLLKLKQRLLLIRQSAESCSRQISGWISSIQQSPVKGKRYLAQQNNRDSRPRESTQGR